MLAVGKHLGPLRQVGAAGIDQIDARQPVLARDLLRAQMLLHRHRIVGAALDGGVVAHDHAFAALDAADAGDDAGAVDRVLVHAVGGERRQFEKRRAGIEQAHHALARQQFAARRRGARASAPARRARLRRGACRSSFTSARIAAALARNSLPCVSIAELSFATRPPRFPTLRAHYGVTRARSECAFMEHHNLADFPGFSERCHGRVAFITVRLRGAPIQERNNETDTDGFRRSPRAGGGLDDCDVAGWRRSR